MKKIKILLVFCILFIASSLGASKITIYQPINPSIETTTETPVNITYIYNLTAALSNIIFDVYDEENGEIAKGRAFGTKGEHKAADILYDNMTALGLLTEKDQLQLTPNNSFKDLLIQLDVLNYTVLINDNTINCFIAPSWKGPQGQPNNLDCTFSYQNLTVKPIPRFPCLYNRSIAQDTQDFVFIGKDQWNDPNGTLPLIDYAKPFLDPLKFYMLFHITSLINIMRHTACWYRLYPQCKGLILYDFNAECFDAIYFARNGNSLPVIFCSGNDGQTTLNNLDTTRISYHLTQHYNDSVISYNVIGTIPGTNPDKTVILSCLYDGWWNQGTADSAISMAMVMGIAKYFKENNITPKYTLRFIGFSGEEFDLRGARYYEAVHTNETILAIIDLNQLGFTQNEPRLTLDIVANKRQFLKKISPLIDQVHYVQRTGNVTDLKKIWWASNSIPGNSGAFALNRPDCNALTLFKDGGWVLHHRDGNNHTEGDVLKYFNWTDTLVTTELVLNLTKSIACGDIDLEDGSYQNFDLTTLWYERIFSKKD